MTVRQIGVPDPAPLVPPQTEIVDPVPPEQMPTIPNEANPHVYDSGQLYDIALVIASHMNTPFTRRLVETMRANHGEQLGATHAPSDEAQV